MEQRRDDMDANKLELKDIYDDAILQGSVEDSEIIKRCGAKTKVDGSTELMTRHLSSQKADSLAEKLGGDPKVSYAIAAILYTSTIVYGRLGETFLREKLQEIGEEFSLDEYCNAICESVLRNYNNESRKQKVFEGIKAAMSDSNSVEATAAKAAIMIHEYWNDKDFDKGNAIEEAFLNGEIVEFESLCDKMVHSKFGEIDDATALKNLNIAYNYLKDNLSKISITYKDIYPEVSNAKLLVYYISRLSPEEVERVKELSLQEKIQSANHMLEVVFNAHFIADGMSEEQSDDIIKEERACYTFEELYEKKCFYVKNMNFSVSFQVAEDGNIAGISIADKFYIDFNEPCVLESTEKIYEHRDGYSRITISLIPKQEI